MSLRLSFGSAWIVTFSNGFAVCISFSLQTQRAEQIVKTQGKYTRYTCTWAHASSLCDKEEVGLRTRRFFSEQASFSHFKFNPPFLVLANPTWRRYLHIWTKRNVFRVACSVCLSGSASDFISEASKKVKSVLIYGLHNPHNTHTYGFFYHPYLCNMAILEICLCLLNWSGHLYL